MTADSPTSGELSRLIASIRDDQRNGFAAINARLDRLVSTELFSADQRRVDERLKDLADDIASEIASRTKALEEEKAARVKATEDEKAARVLAIEDQRVAMDKLTTNLRWVAAAIIVPIALFVTNIVLGR